MLMSVQRVACASCGAPIQLPPDIDRLNCAYCGAGLVVQRGEGFVALKMAEQVSQAIQDVGAQTQSAIRSGTETTQVELKRLQLSQQVAALQMQLTTVETEIRTLERSPQTGQVRRQLKDLAVQQRGLLQQIRTLQGALAPMAPLEAGGEQPTGQASSRRGIAPQSPQEAAANARRGGGCILAILAFFIVGAAMVGVGGAIDDAIFRVPKSAGATASSSGPCASIGVVVAFLAGFAVYLYHVNPDAPMWRSLAQRLPGRQKRAAREQVSETPPPSPTSLEVNDSQMDKRDPLA